MSSETAAEKGAVNGIRTAFGVGGLIALIVGILILVWPAKTAAVVTGGVLSTGVVLAALVLPPATLSAQLAMSRAGESVTLFAGADDVSLGVADTTSFGVGDWSTAFATSTRPEAYDGAAVTLTGFVTPAAAGDVNLTRMVISHCVIDAQPASVPVGGDGVHGVDGGRAERGEEDLVASTVQLWPHRHDTDAMFLALLRRH